MSRLGRVPGIAAIYIGTVIGAGFASGQEIWQFFTRFGYRGSYGVVISTFFLMALGSKAMLWGSKIEAQSYGDFLSHLTGGWMGRVGDWIMTIFLVLLTGIMLAGAGAIAVRHGLKWSFGCWGTVAMAVMVLRKRLEGLRGVNSVVIPLLFLTAVILHLNGVSQPAPGYLQSSGGSRWLLAACQYSAYNLFLALPVLVTLHQLEPDAEVLKWGGVLGGFSLGILAFLFHQAIIRMNGNVQEMPLMTIIYRWSPLWSRIYSFVLWGELFSTLLAHTFGLASRLGFAQSRWYLGKILIILSFSVIISRFGFARLVEAFYPLFGLISILILIPLGFLPLPNNRKIKGK